MRRNRTAGFDRPSVSTPHVIVPGAIYSLATAQEALGLAAGTLPREIRLRRLRVSKRAGRYFILGAWLLEWLAGGELQRCRSENGAVPSAD
jgi:hypothetical protein